MTAARAARAVGVRAPYAAVPAAVRAWVEATLGSPVAETAEQVGGFSPGCATRVRCADGTRAFVKAVGSELNADTPTLFRREVTALTLLGSHPLWADLIASYDEDGWVALLLEDVEGTHPDLSDDAVMARLLEATDALGVVMRERAPTLPLPVGDHPAGAFFRPGVVDVPRMFAGWLTAFDHLDELPATLVPGWLAETGDELRAGVATLAEAPAGGPVHADIRNDNLLCRPSGEIVFVDWGGFGIGPDWLDPLLARLERVEQPWFDESLRASPALVAAGDSAVTSWLVGMGTHLAWRSVSAPSANLPTLAAFRRVESARFLDAAARRRGVRPRG